MSKCRAQRSTFEPEQLSIALLCRDLSENKIDSVHGKLFKGLTQLHDLLLSYNKITSIPYDAFIGLSKLQLL